MQYHLENLKVWKESMNLVLEVYKVTKNLPKDEQYGLTQQIRRAAVSVPANIAEGKGRNHKKEYLQFLFMAKGSLYELMTLIQLSWDLGYLNKVQSDDLFKSLSEVTAMLTGLIQTLQ